MMEFSPFSLWMPCQAHAAAPVHTPQAELSYSMQLNSVTGWFEFEFELSFDSCNSLLKHIGYIDIYVHRQGAFTFDLNHQISWCHPWHLSV